MSIFSNPVLSGQFLKFQGWPFYTGSTVVWKMCFTRGVLACVAVVSVSFKPSGASVQGHLAKRSKKVGAGGGGGGGGGAGKERKRLPLSPDILPNAVRQRTGGNDALPLASRLSIKLIDQNDIQLTVYQR